MEALAFVKSQPDLIAPDIQYHFEMIMYRENGRVVIPEHGFTPLFNISRPKSRGWLKIQSADPTQHPRIQPNYFSDPDDIRVYREGIRIGREVLAQRRSTPIEAWSMPPARRPRPMPRSTST